MPVTGKSTLLSINLTAQGALGPMGRLKSWEPAKFMDNLFHRPSRRIRRQIKRDNIRVFSGPGAPRSTGETPGTNYVQALKHITDHLEAGETAEAQVHWAALLSTYSGLAAAPYTAEEAFITANGIISPVATGVLAPTLAVGGSYLGVSWTDAASKVVVTCGGILSTNLGNVRFVSFSYEFQNEGTGGWTTYSWNAGDSGVALTTETITLGTTGGPGSIDAADKLKNARLVVDVLFMGKTYRYAITSADTAGLDDYTKS